MHEFIALAYSEQNLGFRPPHDDWWAWTITGELIDLSNPHYSSQSFYVVMMLERDTEDTNSVAYRRGLGWILANVWDGLNPETTELVLT
jgi:hypothetical protein